MAIGSGTHQDLDFDQGSLPAMKLWSEMTAAIISDDPAFAAEFVSQWEGQAREPALLVFRSAEWESSQLPGCDLTVIGGLDESAAMSVVKKLGLRRTPVVGIAGSPVEVQALRRVYPQALLFPRAPHAMEALVLLAHEAFLHLKACQRAQRCEQVSRQEQPLRDIGRFMLDIRHKLNNVLTSVLGNAELLLLEPATMTPKARAQVQMIHKMGLTLWEMVQQVTNLESQSRLEPLAASLPPGAGATNGSAGLNGDIADWTR